MVLFCSLFNGVGKGPTDKLVSHCGIVWTMLRIVGMDLLMMSAARCDLSELWGRWVINCFSVSAAAAAPLVLNCCATLVAALSTYWLTTVWTPLSPNTRRLMEGSTPIGRFSARTAIFAFVPCA
jgi:hypothetical protein